MRILRVAQKLYPEYPGGGPYHVHAMSRDQAALGHDVTVLTVSEDESLPRRETNQGYTVIRARPTVGFLGNSLSMGLANDLRQASGLQITASTHRAPLSGCLISTFEPLASGRSMRLT